MKMSELKALPKVELRSELEKAREKLFKMRFQAKGKDMENPGLMRTTKKDIARYLTALRQLELADSAGE